MKLKSVIGVIVLIFIMMLPFTVMASDTGLLPSAHEATNTEQLVFKITSGVDTSKNKESTFDKKRTITGTAEEGTKVTISIYTGNEASDNLKNEFVIDVGASGIFSQTVELELGENIINIKVEKENFSTQTKKFVISRKDREIKQELESAIILPGESVPESSTSDNSDTLSDLKR